MRCTCAAFVLACSAVGDSSKTSFENSNVPLPTGTRVELRDATSKSKPLRGRVEAELGDGRVRVRLEDAQSRVVPRDQLELLDPGQWQYAQRRAADEAAFASCKILEVTVGSRAWGLDHAGSDHDLRGVFLWPFERTCQLRPTPDHFVSADGSATYWEIGRTLEQALRADPNTLELLYVPDVRVEHELGRLLREHRSAFASRRIYGSFGRYALAQAAKLDRAARLARHRDLVLEWLRERPELTLDEAARRLAEASLDSGANQENTGERDAKNYLKQVYRSLFDRGLLEENSFVGLARFARNDAHRFELPRDLRPKNAYNLLRVVASAEQWLRTGEPIIETTGQLRERLLAIKTGEVELERALAWTRDMSDALESAHAHCVLPDEPRHDIAQMILFRARRHAARAWLEAIPGPWAPPPTPTP